MSLTATIARFPKWLSFALLTVLLWGAWGFLTKILSASLDVNLNQILFTVGLVPLMVWVVRSTKAGSARHPASAAWAFVTGVLGGLGNIAFFEALAKGGSVSIVGPVTALFPIVAVILASCFMGERLTSSQKVGFVLGLPAIYLLVK